MLQLPAGSKVSIYVGPDEVHFLLTCTKTDTEGVKITLIPQENERTGTHFFSVDGGEVGYRCRATPSSTT